MKKTTFIFSVHDIVEIAMFIAIAIVLDQFLKIPLGATGGSINLSMVPIFIISLRHGWFKGLIASGIIYGFITCLIDAYGIQTYPFDYLLGFSGTCVLGFFARYINDNKNFAIKILLVILSVLIWATIRLFASSLSSVLIWDYTWDAALLYNVSYVGFSAIGVAVVLAGLLYPIIRINKLYPTNYLK